MSTTPESTAIAVMSRWLAGHAGNDELRLELDALDPTTLGPDGGELLVDLRAELAEVGEGQRGAVDRLVRETLEALALGA